MFSADLEKLNFQLKKILIMKTEFEQNENEALNKTDVTCRFFSVGSSKISSQLK